MPTMAMGSSAARREARERCGVVFDESLAPGA